MVAASFHLISALSDPAEIEARYDEVTDLLDAYGFAKAAADSMRLALHDVLPSGHPPRSLVKKLE